MFVLGDPGKVPTPQQTPNLSTITDIMNERASKAHYDVIITTGDNVYPEGLKSLKSKDLDYMRQFEATLEKPHIKDLKVNPTLGNHDHMSDPLNEVFYSNHSSRWEMDNLQYSRVYNIGSSGKKVGLLFIDSDPLRGIWGQYLAWGTYEWIKNTVKSWDDSVIWRMAVFHHPFYSISDHGDQERVVKAIEKLLHDIGMNILIVGHEHVHEFNTFNTRKSLK